MCTPTVLHVSVTQPCEAFRSPRSRHHFETPGLSARSQYSLGGARVYSLSLSLSLSLTHTHTHTPYADGQVSPVSANYSKSGRLTRIPPIRHTYCHTQSHSVRYTRHLYETIFLGGRAVPSASSLLMLRETAHQPPYHLHTKASAGALWLRYVHHPARHHSRAAVLTQDAPVPPSA